MMKNHKTVLVVDDEADVRIYLCTLLEDAGFSVLEACDGDEAMALILNRKPDFISLDLMMPKKSGHKLLYELKRDRVLSRIPVMIVTGHAKRELGPDGMADLPEVDVLSGPGVYLEKPVNPVTYIRSIERALGIRVIEEPQEDLTSLKEALMEQMKTASKEALEQALRILSKK